jgi:ABC-type branched-subunit amino acid transport system ATPase component
VSVAAKAKSSAPVLEVSDLQVHYGLAHVLQGISLKLDKGVLGVIGRNGMGKTTLCQTIMGLKPATSGSIGS